MSRPRTKLLALILGLSPFVIRAETGANLWRFVHPDAKALISIDWSTIRKSHIGIMLREKFVGGNASSPVPGSEFLDDADRFIISSPGQNPDDPSPDAPMLIAVSGHFDLAKVRTVLARHGAKPQEFKSFKVYRPQGKNAKDLAFVLLDSETILIGDSHSLFDSLERSALPQFTPPADSVLARASDMDSQYDFWAIIPGTDPLVGDRLSALLTDGNFDSPAKTFEIGVSLRNGLTADLSLGFEDEATAKAMASQLSKVVRLAAKDRLGEPALKDLEKRLRFNAQGAVAKMTLKMTPQELEKNAQIFEASRKRPDSNLAQVRPVVKSESEPAKPAAPPKPQKFIRIDGLDDGPKDIPYQDHQ